MCCILNNDDLNIDFTSWGCEGERGREGGLLTCDEAGCWVGVEVMVLYL